jgi:hypothetical protein
MPRPEVRVAPSVVAELDGMKGAHARAVAQAIRDIGHQPGIWLAAEPGQGECDRQYAVMAPDDPGAPVAIYRAVGPGSFLVTGLGDRDTYNMFESGGLPASTQGSVSAAIAEAAIGIVSGGAINPRPYWRFSKDCRLPLMASSGVLLPCNWQDLNLDYLQLS